MRRRWKHPLLHWGNTALYFLICHIGWFVCVISAARGLPWIGTLFAAGSLVYHLIVADNWKIEAKLILTTLVVAFFWETAMVRSGVIVYPNGILYPGTAPYWIISLWLLFSIQFNVLYTWLKAHLAIAAVAGALAGPLSFRAGVAMGAAHFPHPTTSMIIIGMGWAAMFPALLALARRWNGFSRTVSRTYRAG